MPSLVLVARTSRLAVLAAVLALAACDDAGNPAEPDAGTLDAATGPCGDLLSGVRVTFAAADPGPHGGATISITVGDAFEAHSQVEGYEMDEEGNFAKVFPYPPGTLPGPGSVDYYYPGPGVINTVGHADFFADTGFCVTVPLTVEEEFLYDAGVEDASR